MKKPAIFIDRDGTIAFPMHDTIDLDKFRIFDFSAEAVRMINNSNYYAIIITNQPGIAKGRFSEQELEALHQKMKKQLEEKGAHLDAIYFCPHHPDKGFQGERPEYKIDCECRKPKPGMILKAAKDLNIDLEHSFMIGDSFRDVLAARNIGIKSIFVKTGEECEEEADFTAENLKSAVEIALKNSSY